MPVFRIVCLANSVKLRGRCIAGLRMDGGGWIRPVSNDAPSRGALFEPQYLAQDGAEVRPLDVIETSFVRPDPKCVC